MFDATVLSKSAFCAMGTAASRKLIRRKSAKPGRTLLRNYFPEADAGSLRYAMETPTKSPCMADAAEPAILQMPAEMPQVAVPPDAETLSTSEISAPMFDMHPPHESIHTWRDFFIHIATIVVGLCIAVGLEQTAEFFHHRHQVSEIRESLRVERSINAYRFSIATEEFHRLVPKLQGNLAIFQYLLSHPGAPSNQWPGTLTWYGHNIYYHTGAWETAQRSEFWNTCRETRSD